jgi:hypothetical protein
MTPGGLICPQICTDRGITGGKFATGDNKNASHVICEKFENLFAREIMGLGKLIHEKDLTEKIS